MHQTALDFYAILFHFAERILHEASEVRFSEIAAKMTGKDETECVALRRDWVADIGERRGYLSREYYAARFLAASDELHILLNGNEALQAAAYAFGDAWHLLAFEAGHEHALAATGAKAEMGRRQAAPTNAAKGRKRTAIVEALCHSCLSRDTRADRRSGKWVAGAILGDVNEALKARQMRPYKEDSLRKALGPILRKTKA
jgi:hypothetical protein